MKDSLTKKYEAFRQKILQDKKPFVSEAKVVLHIDVLGKLFECHFAVVEGEPGRPIEYHLEETFIEGVDISGYIHEEIIYWLENHAQKKMSSMEG
jgi:hypothetical protein